MKKILLIAALLISGLGLKSQSIVIDYGSYSLEFTLDGVVRLDSGSPTEVIIPSSVTINWAEVTVTSIGEKSFKDCSNLSYIKIPSSVTSIGNEAFCDCSSLTSIEIPSSVTYIEYTAFRECSSLTSIIVEEGNTVYDSRNNCNAIIKTETNTLIVSCQNSVIPNSVTSIGYGAFAGCSSLTSIEIPNSVTSIGEKSFKDCSNLSYIKIPSSVTSIGNEAFCDCSSFASITCYAKIVPETEIDAFEDCPENMTIYVPENSVTAYKSALPWSLYNIAAISDDIVPAVPENLVATPVSTSSIILTWDNAENALSYNVYRDGELITNVTNTNYTDNNLIYNTKYCYTVTSVRNETESEFSDESCVKTLGENISEISSSFSIYPNPVKDEIRISSENMIEEVAVYDVYGRLQTTDNSQRTTDFFYRIDNKC